MPELNIEDAKKITTDDLLAIIASGQLPGGNQWNGMRLRQNMLFPSKKDVKGVTDVTNEPFRQITSVKIYNPNASTAFVRVFDKETVNLAVDEDVDTFVVPAGEEKVYQLTPYISYMVKLQMAAVTTYGGSTPVGSPVNVVIYYS